jgi:hypothetical protein
MHPVQALFSAIGDKLNPQQTASVIDALVATGYSWPRPGKETLLTKQQLAEYLNEVLVAVEWIPPAMYFEFRMLLKAAFQYLRGLNSLGLLPLLQQRKCVSALHFAANIRVHKVYILGFEVLDVWVGEMCMELGGKPPMQQSVCTGAVQATRWINEQRKLKVAPRKAREDLRIAEVL